MVPSLTGQRLWALSLYSCPLSSPPSRMRSVSNFRVPSRRSFRFAGCKSANAAERSTNSGSAAAVPVASSHCSKASASTRRRWSGPSPPSLPLASSCSGCSSGPPCGAALALPLRPALKNSASEPVLKPGSSQLLAVHELRGTLVRPHSRPLGRMAGLRSLREPLAMSSANACPHPPRPRHPHRPHHTTLACVSSPLPTPGLHLLGV